MKTTRRICTWAYERGYLPAAPAWRLKDLTLAKEEGREPFRTIAEIRERIARGGLTDAEVKALRECLYLTGDEIAAVLEHVRTVETDQFAYSMFCFCALTGARRSELLRSRIDDFDFRNRRVVRRRARITC